MTLERKTERERIHAAKFVMTANYYPTSEAPRERETVLGTEPAFNDSIHCGLWQPSLILSLVYCTYIFPINI